MKIPGLDDALKDLKDLPEKTDAMVDKLDQIIALMEQIEKNTRPPTPKRGRVPLVPGEPWPGE